MNLRNWKRPFGLAAGLLLVATAPLAAQDDDDDDWRPRYIPGQGVQLVDTDDFQLNWTVFSYVRYLNRGGLDESYTDSFGRTFGVEDRNDFQLAKVNLSFKGFMFDPRFRYLFYVWTSNASQGDPAQVVVAGNIGYQFADAFKLYGGIGALPTTRSTNNTFPNWLKNDHRGIADEYFRGSYTTGIWATGEILPRLHYSAMLGNNLSQLGVNAAQLDEGLNTYSGALWWMPTTGEYGAANGFGDFEGHDEIATLFGVHFTRSKENAQAQPGTEGFENSQIRLSDGTRIFSEDPFLTGSNVENVTYQMFAVNGGVKFAGFSLDAEAYFRTLSDFETDGPIPVDEITDNGFQVQGSAMVLPQELMLFAQYSKIFGDNGDPYDFTTGAWFYPFKNQQVRITGQGLYLKDSPVGYSSVPFTVGGNGWVFSLDVMVAL